MGIFKDFRTFIMRGNVVDLAIAVVIGAAFTAVVTAVVSDLITPLIAAMSGSHSFSGLTFTIHHSTFAYGLVVNALVAFLTVAAVIFFFVVRPLNAIAARKARGQEPEDPATKQCTECLSDIPVAARRCAFCTSVQDLVSDLPAAPASGVSAGSA